MFEFIVKTIIEVLIIGGFLVGIVKYIFDKKLEAYKTQETIRLKAILVAELLAEWCSDPADRKKLHQLTWEASIWLPKDLATRLNQCLSYSKDAPNLKEIVADVRKLILGDNEAINANEIVHFPPKEDKKLTQG